MQAEKQKKTTSAMRSLGVATKRTKLVWAEART